MNPEQEIGRLLGEDGVAGVVRKAEQYCVHEEQHIALSNHARILELKAELSLLTEEETRVRTQLRAAPAPMDLRHYGRKKMMAWMVAIILTVAGFFLAALTFAPFRLGWQGYVFCAGICTVVPFLLERLLEDGRFEVVAKGVTTAAAIAGITSLMLLADVRGHLLEHEVQGTPTVIIDGAQSDQQPPPDEFYAKTLGSLRLATVLLAFAMELGAGLGLRDAMAKPPFDPEEWGRLRNELGGIRGRMIALIGEITRLEDGPAIFHARFWREFYRSMLTQTVRSAMTKLLVMVVAVALVPAARAATRHQLNLVIALDLTKSTDVKDPDGTTEFQKNVDGVTGVLAQAPSGSHVTIIGVTDRSFAQPYILLSATMPEEPGYFGERLSAAHSELIRVWKQRSRSLTPNFMGTDLLGALRLASHIFSQPPRGDRNVLVLFSDMRNRTAELNLESTNGRFVALKQQTQPTWEVNLAYVEVFMLGVDGAGGTRGDWREIARYWRDSLDRSGANVKELSPLRQLSLTGNR